MTHKRAPLKIVVALIAILAIATVGLSTGAGSSRAATSHKTVVVVLKNIMFSKMTVKIHPGDTVKWEWKDGPEGVHNITPLHKKGGLVFKGAGNRSKGSYSVTFTKKGTYFYECSIHPLTMQGKIVVS